MYNFFTKERTNDINPFGPLRWYRYVLITDDGIGCGTVDECMIELGSLENILPAKWSKVPQWVVNCGDAPTLYKVEKYTPGIRREPWYVNEEELDSIQESKVCSWNEFLKFVKTLLPQLELIELRKDQLSPPLESLPAVATFTPGCFYEIWLSGLDLMEVSDLEEIGEEIDEELEKHDAGEVIGMGGTDGQDHHNIAVQCGPGKDKQALTCIRRVLKRLKANPETTDIFIQGGSGKNLGLKWNSVNKEQHKMPTQNAM